MDVQEMRTFAAEFTGELFKKMGFETKIDVHDDTDGGRESFVCMVTVPREDSKLLIGQYGANLSALQHLVQHLVRRKNPEMKPFLLDVNRYWKEKRSLLEQDAMEAAHKALATGRPVLLRPMVAYERKIIHTVLAKNDRVETESMGKGEERKVIVKPSSII